MPFKHDTQDASVRSLVNLTSLEDLVYQSLKWISNCLLKFLVLTDVHCASDPDYIWHHTYKLNDQYIDTMIATTAKILAFSEKVRNY